jgi:hypothetical protein
VRHRSLRTDGSPSGRSMLVSGRDPARHCQVSWFGWNRRFPVPAMHAFSADGPCGSRIAEGNRRSRRSASLNRMVDPRDHGRIRRAPKNALTGEKNLDPEHSRLEPFILVGEWERADRDVSRSVWPSPIPQPMDRLQRASPFDRGPEDSVPWWVQGRSPCASPAQPIALI